MRFANVFLTVAFFLPAAALAEEALSPRLAFPAITLAVLSHATEQMRSGNLDGARSDLRTAGDYVRKEALLYDHDERFALQGVAASIEAVGTGIAGHSAAATLESALVPIVLAKAAFHLERCARAEAARDPGRFGLELMAAVAALDHGIAWGGVDIGAIDRLIVSGARAGAARIIDGERWAAGDDARTLKDVSRVLDTVMAQSGSPPR